MFVFIGACNNVKWVSQWALDYCLIISLMLNDDGILAQCWFLIGEPIWDHGQRQVFCC